jgi:membrane-associated phospholipid phosphatase
MAEGEIEKAIKDYKEIFYAVGYFSEIIMIIGVSCLLYHNTPFFVIYLGSMMVSIVLNQVLKRSIKDPRPPNPKKFLASEHFLPGGRAWGMPSGHSQATSFSLAFYYLVKRPAFNDPWLIAGFVVCLLCLYERWYFRNHTVPQLIVGVAIGIGLASLVWYLAS